MVSPSGVRGRVVRIFSEKIALFTIFWPDFPTLITYISRTKHLKKQRSFSQRQWSSLLFGTGRARIGLAVFGQLAFKWKTSHGPPPPPKSEVYYRPAFDTGFFVARQRDFFLVSSTCIAVFALLTPRSRPVQGKKFHCLATKNPVSKAVLEYLWFGRGGAFDVFHLYAYCSKTARPICAQLAPNDREDDCFCETGLRFLIGCLVFAIYAIKVGKFDGKVDLFGKMLTTLPLSPDGETTSTLHYFCIKLHHFAYRTTPIDTVSFPHSDPK